MREEPDYYAILGVDPTVSADDLRERHRQLVRELHPDIHAGDPHFAEQLTIVNAAFYELREEFRRSAYDRRRREASGAFSQTFKRRYTQSEEEEAPRVRFVRTFRLRPTTEDAKKKRLLAGSFVSAVAAAAVLCIIMSLSSSQPPSPLAYSDIHSAGASIDTSDTAVESNNLRQQNLITEQAYENRLEATIADIKGAVVDANGTAAELEDSGDDAGAMVLRDSIADINKRITAVTVQVSSLGALNSTVQEGQLERRVDDRLAQLELSEKLLLAKSQKMRAVNSVSDSIDSQPSQNTGGSEGALSTSTAL